MSKRNRIVIDLNQPPQPRVNANRARSRQSRGAGRVLAIIGIIIVVVLLGTSAGVYFWWQHFKAQPVYTLALLVDAAQRNDKQEIDRILDDVGKVAGIERTQTLVILSVKFER